MSKSLLIAGMLVAGIVVALAIVAPEPLRQLDRISYDLMLRGLGEHSPHPDVLVVDIDEASLAQHGQWPWPRHLVAQLLDLVRDGRPAAIGIDILFPEADRSSLQMVNQMLSAELGTGLDISSLPPEVIDRDWALSQTLQRGSFYLGGMFLFDKGSAAITHLPATTISTTHISRQGDRPPPFPVADSVVAAIPQLAASADGFGFTNVLPDPDGITRRIPLLIRHGDALYPSLALAVTMAAGKQQTLLMESTAAGAASIRIGKLSLPVDHQGNLAVRYRGPAETYPYISAAKLLDASISPEIFNQKIVFVGSSAEGLKDIHATPFDRRFPGVEVHATVAGAILDGDFISIPVWTRGIQAIGAVVAGLLALTIVLRFSPWAAGLTLVTFLFVVPLITTSLLTVNRLFISPVPTLVVCISSFTLLALVRFRHEELLVLSRERQLAVAQDCAIVGWASLAETRDTETGNHIFRTQKYVRVMAQQLADHPLAEYRLQPEDIELLFKSAPLHDVGKIGVADRILLKPGPLTPAEFAEMKKHTLYGARALARAESASGITDDTSFLKTAREIALTHHEKWDGSGYPHGLKGNAIPLSGRLMALADVYDALISRRVYKEAMSHDQAAAVIRSGRGSHFDPAIVAAFEALEHEFLAISQEYADTPAQHIDPCETGEGPLST